MRNMKGRQWHICADCYRHAIKVRLQLSRAAQKQILISGKSQSGFSKKYYGSCTDPPRAMALDKSFAETKGSVLAWLCMTKKENIDKTIAMNHTFSYPITHTLIYVQTSAATAINVTFYYWKNAKQSWGIKLEGCSNLASPGVLSWSS